MMPLAIRGVAPYVPAHQPWCGKLLNNSVTMTAIPYWASPDAKVTGFTWIIPGSFLTLVI
jgi:hypothetical protein